MATGEQVDWKALVSKMQQRAHENAQAASFVQGPTEEQLYRARAVRFLLMAGFEKRVTHELPDWDRVRATGKQLEVLRAYCDGVDENMRLGRGLILTGAPGIGKTMLLALVALSAMPSVAEVYYCKRGEALLDTVLASRYRDDHEEYRAMLRADLLLLDDVDRLFDASKGDIERGIPALDALADDRYAAMRSTVVASNRTVAELAQVPGLARSVDRWRQCMVSVHLAGGSQREAQ